MRNLLFICLLLTLPVANGWAGEKYPIEYVDAIAGDNTENIMPCILYEHWYENWKIVCIKDEPDKPTTSSSNSFECDKRCQDYWVNAKSELTPSLIIEDIEEPKEPCYDTKNNKIINNPENHKFTELPFCKSKSQEYLEKCRYYSDQLSGYDDKRDFHVSQMQYYCTRAQVELLQEIKDKLNKESQ